MNRVFFLEQSSLQKKRVFKVDPWVPWAPQGPQGALAAQHTVSIGFFEQASLLRGLRAGAPGAQHTVSTGFFEQRILR